ncbi:Hypothetical protein R9X50_00383800 [Acrodontium crateriforme]|uniref:Uncharacterized protein n=1 Tax=Acrodontium crateriforme TaxID=150365 RepID=A0AAQ3R7T8_9PEZI|nr:Hypothetical protein R9X50_00383800 [Acrodontium crateriforme]
MPFSCFRAAGDAASQVASDEAPRLRSRGTFGSRPQQTRRTSRIMGRHGSAGSRSSTTSNESISRLPPCPGLADPKVEAMMMPVPLEARPSRCLRLSQPRTYSDIIDSMKQTKGCRDWRSFAVFHNDDVDEMTVEEHARKRAEAHARKMRKLNSQTSTKSNSSVASIDNLLIC